MKTNKLFSVRTALATLVAGAVFVVAGCGDGEGTKRTEGTKGTANGAPRTSRPTGLIPDAAKAEGWAETHKPKKAPRLTEDGKPMLPDGVARILVEHAVNANDYKSLATLRDKVGQIADPETRLRLLEGLTWFDDTAVADSLPFLADADPKVAAQAGEVVASRISSVEKRQDREKVYTAALKLMAEDSPDRDILIATLENDRKDIVMRVLRDLEPSKDSDPELWQRLTEAYETSTGRPYKGYVDALIHYDPRDDR